MIGGIEIRIPSRAGDWSLEVSVRAIRQRWPQAVFENAESADRYNDFGEIPFSQVEELFVYRDSDARDVWDAEGAVPLTRNTMIHLVADEEMITTVVDEADAEMEIIIGAIRSALADEILNISYQ